MSGDSRCDTVGFLTDMLGYARSDVAAEVLSAEQRELPIPPVLLTKVKELVALTGDATAVMSRLPRSSKWR
jgi:hypothetical protein